MSESKELREEKKAGGARDELKKVSRLLGDGDDDQLVRGRQEGSEEGVSRENTTPT